MLKEIKIPDIGAYSNVDVIEVLVAPGDIVAVETALISLETDKATMEIPSPFAGEVKSIKLKVGDKVSEGDLILTLEVAELAQAAESEKSKGQTQAESTAQKPEQTAQTQTTQTQAAQQAQSTPQGAAQQSTKESTASGSAASSSATGTATSTTTSQSRSPDKSESVTTGFVHAGPSVRRLARELGVNLNNVSGTGRNNRLVLADVKKYVKEVLSGARGQGGTGTGGSGLNLAAWPTVDHTKFGEVIKKPLPRIKKLSGGFLHRNWVMVPHVTQFDEADITEMDQFRRESQNLAEAQKIKLTPLVFIMKAVVSALKAFPTFNASLDASGSELILKQYFHIGVAVDTPNGLMVPVVRDVDQKGLFELAKELGEISAIARDGKLSAEAMQGSSFSISSLGGIGGTYFTPIVNVPDVAILGVSKAQIKPIFMDDEFKPRLMLPLSLSYDHRVIDGAEAARFTTYLVKQLSDVRRLLL